MVRKMPLAFVMKLWGNRVHPTRCGTSLRHEFVIGPLCDSSLFSKKARLYYCIRCRWNFLVCESRVAVLDEVGNVLIGIESSDRFNTFEEGPCPVLRALTSDVPSETETATIAPWRNGNERRNLASSNVRLGPTRPRLGLRVFTRLREDLGR
jgi:hypothetical protein